MQGIKKQISKFDFETIRNEGQIRFDRKSGQWHKDKLIDLCQDAMKNGNQFFTRARHYKSGKVADFYNVPFNTVIEIADSESDESLRDKQVFWEKEGFNFNIIKRDKNEEGI
jgi:hypothetical protein